MLSSTGQCCASTQATSPVLAVWVEAGMCVLSRYLMTGVGGEEIKSLGPGPRLRLRLL